jgi:hypothetical protein
VESGWVGAGSFTVGTIAKRYTMEQIPEIYSIDNDRAIKPHEVHVVWLLCEWLFLHAPWQDCRHGRCKSMKRGKCAERSCRMRPDKNPKQVARNRMVGLSTNHQVLFGNQLHHFSRAWAVLYSAFAVILAINQTLH